MITVFVISRLLLIDGSKKALDHRVFYSGSSLRTKFEIIWVI